MGIDARYLEELVCTACHGGLRAVDDDTGLECRECRRIFPVRDGIPTMLLDQAKTPGPAS